MPFTAPAEEEVFSAPSDEVVQQELPKAEGPFMSFVRPILSNIVPSVATAAGGVAGGLAGGALGLESGPGAVATGIAGDIAGGTAAGAAAQKLQDYVLGEEYVKQMRAQEQANMEANPFLSKMGTMIGQLPSVFGGGAKFAQRAATEAVPMLERVGEAAVQGARMGGSEAAQEKVSGAPGSENLSIPEEMIKGAATFGPTGLLGPAKTLLGAVGIKAPTDAALMATSGALYDTVAHGKPFDPEALAKQIGADVPGFALLNAFGHVMHATPTQVPAEPHPLDSTIEANAQAGNPQTAQALENLKAITTAKAQEPKPIPENAIPEQSPGPSLLGTEEAEPQLNVGLPPVGRGNPQPEITAGESKIPPEGPNPALGGALETPQAAEVTGTGPETPNAPEATETGKERQLTEDQETEVGLRVLADEAYNRLADEGKVEEANARREQIVQEVLGGQPATKETPFADYVRENFVKDLPEAGKKRWTPEAFEAVQRFADTGNPDELASLTPIQQGRVQKMFSEWQEAQPKVEAPPVEAKTPEPPQTPPPPPETPAGQPPMPETVGGKNASVEEQRTALGLEPVLKSAPEEVKESFAKTKAKVEADPEAGEKLVKEIEDTGRYNLTPEEQGILTHEMVTVNNGIREANRVLDSPDSTPEEKIAAQIRHTALIDRLNRLHDVNTKAGNLWGKFGVWRQQMLNKDYSLENMQKRAIRAKGEGLSAGEHRQLSEISKTIEEATKEVEEAEKSRAAEGTRRAKKLIQSLTKERAKAKERITREDIQKKLTEFKLGKLGEIKASVPPEEGFANVAPEHQQKAVEELRKTGIGRRILKSSLIVPTWQKVLSHPVFEGREFTGKEINTIRRAEGFFDPQTGQSVVIRENVVPKEGESPVGAVKRVLLHERVGHDGLNALRKLDPQFDKEWHSIVSKIPEEELAQISKAYPEDDREGLINEWFARKFEALDPNEIPDPKTPFGKIWQAIRDFLARYFGNDTKLDQKVRDLMGQVLRSDEAMEFRQGQGHVVASLPEENPKDFAHFPHSILDLIAKYHVQEGLDKEHPVEDLTSKIKETLSEVFPNLTDAEVHQKLSRYGEQRFPSQEEAAKQLRDLKAQMRLLSQLKDAKEGVMPKLTGLLRDKPSQEVRELEKQVNNEIRAQKLHRGSDEQQRASALDAKKTRLNHEIEDVEKQLKTLREGGQIEKRERNVVPGDAESKALEEKLAALRKERDQINDDLNSQTPQSPEEYRRLIQSKMKAVQDRIAELEDRLKNGELFPEGTEEHKTSSAELEDQRSKLAKLKEEMAERRKQLESHTPQSPQQYERAVEAILKRKESATEELERRMREGEFERAPKKEPLTDPRIEAANVKLARARQTFENLEYKFKQGNRTKEDKVWDTLVRGKRAFVLSSALVFGKLAAAAQTRSLTTLAEELVNHGLHAALPEKFTSKAALEGRGNVRGYAKAWLNAYKRWGKDANDIMKTGQSDLDVLYGKYKGQKEEGLDSFLGRLHAVMKAPTKQAAFDHAFEKLAESALRKGENPQDPVVNARIGAQAYKVAQRAIFMQDSAAVKGFQGLLRILENHGGTAKAAARIMRVLLPIVKVPTNLVAESLQYAGGVPVGLTKLAKAWSNGFKDLKPEEADLIMRQLKKGSLGTALMALGFLGASSIGGYYQEHEKRKIGEPKAGGVKLFGVDVPSWLMHAPALEVLQMGATLRRVAEANTPEGEKRGIPAGILAALFGVVSETPFVNEMTRLQNIESPEGRERWLGDVAKAQVEPQLLQQIAKWTDTGPARKPETFAQDLEMGIPGLRQNVPIKVSDALPPSDNGKVPPQIEKYALAGGVMPSKPSQATLRKSNPKLTKEKWERYVEMRGKLVKSMLLEDIPHLKELDEKGQRGAVAAISKMATDQAKRELGLN